MFWVAAILTVTVWASSTEPATNLPKLYGYLQNGGRPLFALSTSSQLDSKWVPLGGNFNGFNLSSFDKGKEILVLTSAQNEYRIQLEQTHIQTVRTLSRPEAVGFFRNFVGDIKEASRRYKTYCDLPPSNFELLVEKMGEKVAINKRAAAESKGGKLFVAQAPDGLPVVFEQLPLDFSRFPRRVTENLTEEDRSSVNEQYMMAQLQNAYVMHLAQIAAGNFEPVDTPTSNRRATLPRDVMRVDHH